jgi:hypothetical protein
VGDCQAFCAPHAHLLLPTAIAFVSYGLVLLVVRARAREIARGWQGVPDVPYNRIGVREAKSTSGPLFAASKVDQLHATCSDLDDLLTTVPFKTRQDHFSAGQGIKIIIKNIHLHVAPAGFRNFSLCGVNFSTNGEKHGERLKSGACCSLLPPECRLILFCSKHCAADAGRNWRKGPGLRGRSLLKGALPVSSVRYLVPRAACLHMSCSRIFLASYVFTKHKSWNLRKQSSVCFRSLLLRNSAP